MAGMKPVFIAIVGAALLVAPAFGDTKPMPKDRNWKVLCPSVEGLLGRAVELLTAEMGPLMLRDSDFYTFRVLPVEIEGRSAVGRRNRFVLGTRESSAAIRALVKENEVPRNGYLVRTRHDSGTNIVVIAGDRPVDVLYGVADFVEDGVPFLADKGNGDGLMYRTQVFDGSPLRPYESRRAPKTPVRSLFTWGHVIDDYHLFFREMARLKLNRAIIWNDFAPLNAGQVVECAHSWGVEVYWGFPWGWDTDCSKSGKIDLEKLAEAVLDDWRRNWKQLPGDGIYFQTFTELSEQTMAGESVASRAIRLVNKISGRMLAEEPETRIVFGLHATSVKNDLESIARVDSRLGILWEDCGAFPWHWGYESTPGKDDELLRSILHKTQNASFALKGQLLQDWNHWEHQAGPFMLGCAGKMALDHDRRIATSLLEPYNARWIAEGERVHGIVRLLQSDPVAPRELNTVTEYNPPFEFQTAMLAELMWSSEEDYVVIRNRVLKRSKGKN